MKKIISVVITIIVCFAMSISVFAASSPEGGEALGGEEIEPGATTTTSVSDATTSPTTSDTLVVPGLAVIALGGAAVAVVSKKKIREQQ